MSADSATPWSRLRDLAERVVHPWRRRRARAALRREAPPKRLLFVCLGNVCRSPYAARAFARELAPALRRRIEVGSAGFVFPDRSSPDLAVQVAGERGVDLTGHRSKLLSPELMGEADWIFVMEEWQLRVLRRRYGPAGVWHLGDFDPLSAVPRRAVTDPIDASRDVYRSTYERIDRCVEEVVRLTELAWGSGEDSC